MHPFSGFTSLFCQYDLKAEAIYILPLLTLMHPHIFANYLSAKADQLCAIRSVRFARKMTEMPL